MDCHSGGRFSLIRLGLAVWHKGLQRSSSATFVDISAAGRPPTTVAMGMRIQSPRSMLRTLRRIIFHEVAYQPWNAAHGNPDKQQRRFERLVKISYVLDFKTMGGMHRGVEAAAALTACWQRVPEHLLMADSARIREASYSAPPQLCYFLMASARVCEMAAEDEGELARYDEWLGQVVFPIVTDHFPSDD